MCHPESRATRQYQKAATQLREGRRICSAALKRPPCEQNRIQRPCQPSAFQGIKMSKPSHRKRSRPTVEKHSLIAVSIQRVEQAFWSCGSDSSTPLSSLSEPAEAASELAREGDPRASRKDDRGIPLPVDSGPNQSLSPTMCHPEVRAPRSYQKLQHSFARGAEGSAPLLLRDHHENSIEIQGPAGHG